MGLSLTTSSLFKSEKQYIFNVLLEYFLGQKFDIIWDDNCKNEIRISSSTSNKQIVFSSQFFTDEKDWLTAASLPKQPLQLLDLSFIGLPISLPDLRVPIIYGTPAFQDSQDILEVGLDIFGGAFFMLSRYEEVVKTDRDKFDRFPAKASLAFQEGFLMRPIVNEYVEILWGCMEYLWPELKRMERKSRTLVSCDVDYIRAPAYYSLPKFIKKLAADILVRKSIRSFLDSLETFINIRIKGDRADPYVTFDFLMEECERYNLKNEFYFICDHSFPKMDGGCYSMNESKVRNLFREIYDRGHLIGLHTSFNTYKNPDQTKKEANILKEVCEQENIQQDTFGGRQHYLRWKTSQTAANWEAAKMNYDSTLGFADSFGFRCGTCYEYPLYDLEKRTELKLQERPLLVMEVSLNYMNLNYSEGESLIDEIKSKCSFYNGDFTLLWHNSNLNSKEDKEAFINAIRPLEE